MIKLMIATPAQRGQLDIEYAYSFAKTLHDLSEKNIPVSVILRRSGSLLISERNKILWQFWTSDCSHLLCIDADIGWNSDDVFSMLNRDKKMIGGCYHSKGNQGFLFRPISYDHVDIEPDGLILAKAIPFGFVMISRQAIGMMIDNFPDLYYKSVDEKDEGYGLFNTMVEDGQFWGEDYSFCLRANKSGVELWIDPSIELSHDGKKEKLIDALTGDNNELTDNKTS